MKKKKIEIMKILFKIKISFIYVILYMFASSAFSHLYKLNVISIIEMQNILNINYCFFLF